MKKNNKIFLEKVKAKVFVDVSKSILAKKGKYKGLPPSKTAESFWELNLKNEKLIKTAQNPKCEFAVLVPVYNESVKNISEQINSIKNQKGINASQIEIIYVVNNNLPKSNRKSRQIIKSNEAVIKYLNDLEEPNIFVIDKSSSGNEISNCNVGKARNRAIAEASFRFQKNNKNGFLIQTDADTVFEDQYYFLKVKSIFKDKRIIGVAGGLILEVNSKKKSDFGQKINLYMLYKKWNVLINFLNSKNTHIYLENRSFYGANMISRSYESAKVGGVIEANAEEDTQFGLDLIEYSRRHKKKVVSAREKLKVVCSLRASDRTYASFKKYFDKISKDTQIVVNNAPNKKPKTIILNEVDYRLLKSEVSRMKDGLKVLKYIKNNFENIRFN